MLASVLALVLAVSADVGAAVGARVVLVRVLTATTEAGAYWRFVLLAS